MRVTKKSLKNALGYVIPSVVEESKSIMKYEVQNENL